jgi:Protein of unknown function (DUF3455)
MTTIGTRSITTWVAAILAVCAAAPQQMRAQQGERVTPPAVPANLIAPAGTRAFLEGHAIGTQNYICLPTATGFAWTFYGPQATLFNDQGKQIVTHFLSANPDETGALRATWQHSNDTSAVWAAAIQSSTDPMFVAPGAIPWLLLQVLGDEAGPTGGDRLTPTLYIQRVHTSGGVMPATGCAATTDVGKRTLVPYEADYVFYKQRGDGDASE